MVQKVAISPAPREDAAEAELRAARGDRDALATLLRQHGRAIQELCRFVAGPVEGPDAAQEAFEKIVSAIGRFDPARGRFRTWALTVARNTCRDRLRRRTLQRNTFAADGEPLIEGAPAAAPTPEGYAVARGEATRLDVALATLPENMRSVLVLFHFHEQSYEEIASTLGVPKGTVMTWLHRGRKRLRESLDASAGSRSLQPEIQA
ncbi:MAG: RNA polymerase sigma factor [Myxococcota bacterium]